MLFTTHATASDITLPRITRGTRYQPKSVTSGVVAASSAVAPAGGWIVLVSPITADDVLTARAPASQRRLLKPSPVCWKALVMAIPIMAERICPKITLRGWASGEEMLLYSRIAEAPKEAMIISLGGVGPELEELVVGRGRTWKRRQRSEMPAKAPMKDQT